MGGTGGEKRNGETWDNFILILKMLKKKLLKKIDDYWAEAPAQPEATPASGCQCLLPAELKLGKHQKWGLKSGVEAARGFTCYLFTSLKTNFTEATYNSHMRRKNRSSELCWATINTPVSMGLLSTPFYSPRITKIRSSQVLKKKI